MPARGRRPPRAPQTKEERSARDRATRMTRELVHLNSQLSHTSLTPAGRVELLDYILQTERAHATAKATHEELARQRAAKNDQLRQSWQLQQTRKTVDMEDA
ncbi:hypothetical protein BU14_0602s0007 [Porphyra umbilicalis]|uniref:Uncharacterized protein n=1 Tax=Porphyra umbilicalis TaxID=2786 RepID=A0A1X6NR78_PORUM|nr:hypothetical protein BU14_0602s0007 [Porphyra umbilicalis]|eukprot:OSX71098.1 hypothetical protein BU14_0602s0007 [Porphyra umbilicalis]